MAVRARRCVGDEAQENCRKQIIWWSYMHYCFAFILGSPDSQSIAPETSWVAPGPGSNRQALETTGLIYTSALGMLQGSSKKLCEGYRLPRRDCLGTPCGPTSDMLHVFCMLRENCTKSLTCTTVSHSFWIRPTHRASSLRLPGWPRAPVRTGKLWKPADPSKHLPLKCHKGPRINYVRAAGSRDATVWEHHADSRATCYICFVPAA